MIVRRKKKFNNYIYVLVILNMFGLIDKCSGTKTCPEMTRVHKTRCDKYFRCINLPTNTYVWIPKQCEQGLIYEPSLKTCVVPGDNWECNITNEIIQMKNSNDDTNIYGVDNIQIRDVGTESSEEIYNGNYNNENVILIDEDNDNLSDPFVIETTTQFYKSNDKIYNDMEYSGDGAMLESKEGNSIPIPESVVFDNRLTIQLQRLTQLIDNIKNENNSLTLDNKTLVADQLNHILDKYNIITLQSEHSNINDKDKLLLPDDGNIPVEYLNDIVKKQNKLSIEDFKPTVPSIMNSTNAFPVKSPNVKLNFNSNTQVPSSNSNLVRKNYRRPENGQIKRPSQIIVNRPGGSILFNLNSNNKLTTSHTVTEHTPVRDEPYISEETMKTILKLSKQMIETEHVPQVYPIYYTVPIPILSNLNKYSEDGGIGKDKETAPMSLSHTFNSYKENENIVKKQKDEAEHSYRRPDNFDSFPNQSNQKYNSYGNPYYPTQDSYYPSFTNTGFDSYQQPPYPFPSNPSSQYNYNPATNYYNQPSNYHTSYNPGSYYSNYNQMFPSYVQPTTSTTTTTTTTTTTPQPTTTKRIYSNEQPDDDGVAVMEPEYESQYYQNIYNNRDSYKTNYPTRNKINLEPFGLGEFITNNDESNVDKLINIGGSYVSYDRYKNAMLPLLQQTSSFSEGIEVLTCTSGVRQPNTTDCSKYYVCNPKTHNVLSYSCPPFTAFNKLAKICDGKTYAFCKPEAILNRYTVEENIQIQNEAHKVLEDAKRIKAEALKTQALTNLIRLQTEQLTSTNIEMPELSMTDDTNDPVVMNTKPVKRRRIRCLDTGKISDPDSINDYWICFRGKDGRMRRQKMTCSNELIFCKSMRLCTLQSRCNK